MEPDIKMRLHTPAYLDMIYVDLTLFNVNIMEHGQPLLPVLVNKYDYIIYTRLLNLQHL